MNIGHDGKEYYILITRPNGSSYKIRCEDKQSLIMFLDEVKNQKTR
jgi:hypothetical protein